MLYTSILYLIYAYLTNILELTLCSLIAREPSQRVPPAPLANWHLQPSCFYPSIYWIKVRLRLQTPWLVTLPMFKNSNDSLNCWCLIHSTDTLHCWCLIDSNDSLHCWCLIHSNDSLHCWCLIHSNDSLNCWCLIHSNDSLHCWCLIHSNDSLHCWCLIHSNDSLHCWC